MRARNVIRLIILLKKWNKIQFFANYSIFPPWELIRVQYAITMTMVIITTSLFRCSRFDIGRSTCTETFYIVNVVLSWHFSGNPGRETTCAFPRRKLGFKIILNVRDSRFQVDYVTGDFLNRWAEFGVMLKVK